MFTALALSGCLNTQGTLELRGKVMDEFSKKEIPWRKIIIQAEIESNYRTITVDCGQFSTDSAGKFSYTLKKIRDAYNYNFCFVGDSNYASVIKRMGLFEIKENSKYLFFNLSKLTDIKINIDGVSSSSICDTIYLTWESEGIDYDILYPYEIKNFGSSNNYVGRSHLGLLWIGSNTRSTIKTKVFAGKLTRLKWEVVRNNRRRVLRDTITCKRDMINNVNFKF